MIDFSKVSVSNNSDTALNPRDIFTALPGKQAKKFQYPRDVQGQVWEQWFQRRKESNIVIKMNTGSGKTVVGLLILKSSLNEGVGPAVYIVPDNYLVQQVLNEALALGIAVTSDPSSPRFLSGKEILVANIFKLVNGKSVFGVGSEGVKIRIGAVIIDDAHACLDSIEDQFTLSLAAGKSAADEVYAEVRQSLHDQCESKAIELESGDPTAYMMVPFWAWQAKLTEITRVMVAHRNDDEIKFVWPLIKENIKLSRCVVSSSKLEVSPHCIPIGMIPSLSNARRKIFMTATLVDDSVLVSHFGITEESAANSIMPATFGDVGDRMILMPQVINPSLTDDEIKEICVEVAKTHNVVVIVPSEVRSKFWEDSAKKILRKDSIIEGVEALKEGHVGLVVLVNRYDGIDLPNDACRLLVVDGLPDVRRLIDKVEQGILLGSDRVAAQVVQRIEQGMGRGIRSSDDYCAVLLIGRALTSNMYADGAFRKFSPGTLAQIQLSEQIASQISGGTAAQIIDSLKYCLEQNPDWVKASRGAVASVAPPAAKEVDAVAVAHRKAYDAAASNDMRGAGMAACAISNVDDLILRGYLKQCAAEYVNLYDQVEAQKILLSGISGNPRILKPIEGVAYHKLEGLALDQARACREFLLLNPSPNAPVIRMNALLEDLVFKPDTANRFEQALKEVARFVGFKSQRPELEFKKGPDVLWAVGGLSYFVIECKNGAISGSINKHDCNQLNGSGEWFRNRYDESCTFTPIMIHPSNTPEHAASLNANTRLIGEAELALLRKNLFEFVKSVCTNNQFGDEEAIRDRLAHFRLRV